MPDTSHVKFRTGTEKGVLTMPHFAYTAIDSNGKQVKQVVEADSESTVVSRLREQSLHVVEVRETKQAKAGGGSFGKKKMKPKSLVVFSRQFATMIDAGIPILRCMEILTWQCKDIALKEVLEQIFVDVKSGIPLNEAMTKHPNIFSKLYVNMVRAAEVGGILDIILDRLSTFLEYEADVRAKIKSAMMYPVMVLVFSQLMLFALFTFVLPRFKDIFKGMDVELPAITKFLFGIGDFMQAHWVKMILAMIAAFFAFKYWSKTPGGRYKVDWLKLRMPIVGDLSLKMSVARFCRTFGTLLNSGVPMMRSLEIVSETLSNRVLQDAIDATRSSIREGQRLSAPMVASGLFPPMVTHMIDIGEETGRLPEMLVKISEFYDAEVETAVKGLTSMIEPLLIIFMGVVVGFIAIAVMTPIFSIIQAVS
jgi:type IV pilus assembly protein PilC